MSHENPPVDLDFRWEEGLLFRGDGIVLDGNSKAGPSPVQALGFALAGCMGSDVVDILAKGHYKIGSLSIHFHGERAPSHPRRFLKVALRFRIAGDIPQDRVARAIDLSREKYCSVWHSLRPDIDFETSFEVVPG